MPLIKIVVLSLIFALAAVRPAVGQERIVASFTVDEGSWMSLDVSPDGATIAFDMLGDIYSMSSRGGEATAILRGPVGFRSPQFSPDGSQIAFISDESGSDNVWIAAADGSDRRQISFETDDLVMGPAWAPDGRSIAAIRIYPTFDQMKMSEVWNYPLDGAKPVRLVQTPENKRDVQEPRYAPDGEYLYYTQRRTQPNIYINPALKHYEIRRRRLPDGPAETVVAGFGGATTAQISPDGKRMAFVRRVRSKTVLFVFDPEAGTQIPVFDGLERDLQATFTPDEHYYPAYDWFPDNRHIAIWAQGKIHKLDTQARTAEIIPFSATAEHSIARAIRPKREIAPNLVEVKAIRHLAAGPESGPVVFRAVTKLWRANADGTSARRLSRSDATEHDPSWSSDGRRLVYVAWADETGSEIRVRTMRSGRERVVYATSGIVREPSFSPDGRRIVFRTLPGNVGMGGFRIKPGIHIVPANGGELESVAADGSRPQFSPDGESITFVARGYGEAGGYDILQSVSIASGEVMELGRGLDADVRELRVSPDHRWIAFKDQQQYYIAPFALTSAPVVFTGRDDPAAIRVTEIGGFEIVWTATSDRVDWVLGAQRYSADAASGFKPRRSGRVDLSLEAQRTDDVTLFRNARILTMDADSSVIEDGAILIEGNRITAVGPSNEIEAPRRAHVVDATGMTIMPGIFDAHSHTDCCYDEGATPQKEPTQYASLAYGVTTNFDPYSSDLVNYERTEAVQAGLLMGPRWMGSGAVVYGRSRKGDATFEPIAELDDARRIMQRKSAYGAPIIKSYKQPSRGDRRMLVQAGNEQGIMVDGEGQGDFFVDITMIIDGHSNLEHNLPIANYYDDVVQLFAASGSSNTPTLMVAYGELYGENYIFQTHDHAWDGPKVNAYVHESTGSYSPIETPYGAPPYARLMATIKVPDEIWDIGFRSVSRSTKKLDDAGVLINLGSHGQQAGLAAHWEMELLAQGGMSPMRVLRTATINPATSYGLEDDLGSIEPGKLADIIILERNPLEDIRNTNSVRYTMADGRLFDAATLNRVGATQRARGKFYWELDPEANDGWNEAWGWE